MIEPDHTTGPDDHACDKPDCDQPAICRLNDEWTCQEHFNAELKAAKNRILLVSAILERRP